MFWHFSFLSKLGYIRCEVQNPRQKAVYLWNMPTTLFNRSVSVAFLELTMCCSILVAMNLSFSAFSNFKTSSKNEFSWCRSYWIFLKVNKCVLIFGHFITLDFSIKSREFQPRLHQDWNAPYTIHLYTRTYLQFKTILHLYLILSCFVPIHMENRENF